MIYADLRHRYSTVLQFVPENSKLCLDIGGYSSGIYLDLFGEFNLNIESFNQIRDVNLNNIPTYSGDFFNFDFSNKEYDYTFLIDVLEHVNASDRLIMVEKAIKIAQKGSFILFPYKCKENLYLEAKIRNLFVEKGYDIKPTFKEHLNYGLPELEIIFKYLNDNKMQYSFKYVTDRNLFYELFEKQCLMKDENERLNFNFKQCEKLNKKFASDTCLNSYRILLMIYK